MSNPMNKLLDIILDKSGAVEIEAREKLEKAEVAVREMIATMDAQNGEIAFGFAGLDNATLAWFVTLLLRDRIEFSASAEA